jgi:cystathionine beta-lyase/cystathionine gamma-synthase
MSSRLAIPLPEVDAPTDGTFPTQSVLGPFGITAEVERFAEVLTWQEQRALPFQGYYRLVHHPRLKRLLARLRAYYGRPCSIPYAAPGAALKELLEFLDLQAPIHVQAPPSCQPILDTLTFPRRTSGRKVIVHAGRVAALREADALHVAWFTAPPADPADLDGADFALLNLGPDGTPARGAVTLFSRTSDYAELYERNRRHGHTLATRDAIWLDGGEPDVPHDPAAPARVLSELCRWENAEHGLLYPSGMNALLEAFEALCPPDRRRALVVGHPYSDTHLFLTDLAWAGGSFTTTFLRGDEAHRVAELLTPAHGMVFVETITNPLSEVPDLPVIAAACRARGVPLVVDNTMATPWNCRPLDLGADVVVHSTTKYLAGSNDHGGGFTATRDGELARRLRARQAALGNALSPFDALVLERRLASFAERMPRFNANGLALARFLRTHPAVDRVWYCGLEESPYHAAAQRLLRGAAGVVSCTLKDPSRAALGRYYDTPTPHVRKAPSLGSDTTLFCPYVMLTYFKRDDAYLARHHLPRHLLRFSVGCEPDLEPVLAEIDRALRAGAGMPA